MGGFQVSDGSFLLNGNPFRVVAGAMHYFRVPRQYWRDRLLKIKACGFNTVETYTVWNLHEPQEGTFDFSDNLDLKAYLELIGELGMYAIVRPGPYICSEWDFGGLPWWLLRNRSLEPRCRNAFFMEKVKNYFNVLLPIIALQQSDCGGPVVMVQVENEYGSYGNDSVYIRELADLMLNNGITSVLFTSDGSSDTMLSGGSVPEILKVVNFGSDAAGNFKRLRRFQKTGPLMCGEYWNGWFDHWGEKHHRREATDAARTLQEILDCGASVSVYMAHGGTNFGLMNGANCSEGNYQPTVSSYDDDAPISESGALTEKYFAMQRVLAANGFSASVTLEELPLPAAYPTLYFSEYADLLDNLDLMSPTFENETPQTMESLGLGYGMICYQTTIKGPKEKDVLSMTVHDRAYLFLDDKFLGIYDRNDQKQKIRIDVPEEGATLTILVDNMGRVNYGPELIDRKGIVGKVRLGGQFLYHWRMWLLPLSNANECGFIPDNKIKFKKRPIFLRTELTILEEPRDTFVSLPGFKKGVIIVNGKVLSRYWEIGPQRTAYLPATWLRKGVNQICVLELEGLKKTEIQFLSQPNIG